jgi:hypothetical protein
MDKNSIKLTVSMRKDLAVIYARLIAEIINYEELGVNILINRGWLEQEQPPLDFDRKALMKL